MSVATAGWLVLLFPLLGTLIIGLGVVVAMYRRRVPIDVDELRELQG